MVELKIVLPKTLAEPLTIPWAKSVDMKLAVRIKDDLDDMFQYMEKNGITPGRIRKAPSFSPNEVAKTLRTIAKNGGATTAYTEVLKSGFGFTTKNPIHIGYRYSVIFTIPGGARAFRISFDSYFR